jgi:hypothetical protein
MLSKAESQRGENGGSGSLSQVKIGRPCDKNGPSQTRTRYINMGRKNGHQEKWADEDPMARHVQEISKRTMVKKSQKTGANGVQSNTRKSGVSS